MSDRNFCERCGKPISALEWDIHTCTPPAQDDPCPGCRKGGVCRTPKCGRLKLPIDHPYRSEQLAQPQQEPVGRTDQQIVDQTEELAVWLLSWCFNHQPKTKTPMRESTHPFAQRCWAAACHIQEMLTATDPENAVAELDGAPNDDTAPPAQKGARCD